MIFKKDSWAQVIKDNAVRIKENLNYPARPNNEDAVRSEARTEARRAEHKTKQNKTKLSRRT